MEEWRSDRTRQMMVGIKTTETKGGLTTGLLSTSHRASLSQCFMGRRLIFQRRFHPSLGINSLLNRHSCKWASARSRPGPALVKDGRWYSDIAGRPRVLCTEPMSHVAPTPSCQACWSPWQIISIMLRCHWWKPSQVWWLSGLIIGYFCVQISFASCGIMFLWHKQSDSHMISRVCSEYSWLIKTLHLSLKKISLVLWDRHHVYRVKGYPTSTMKPIHWNNSICSWTHIPAHFNDDDNNSMTQNAIQSECLSPSILA